MDSQRLVRDRLRPNLGVHGPSARQLRVPSLNPNEIFRPGHLALPGRSRTGTGSTCRPRDSALQKNTTATHAMNSQQRTGSAPKCPAANSLGTHELGDIKCPLSPRAAAISLGQEHQHGR